MICKKCNKEFPINVWIDGKRKNLCNREYCLECSPFKKRDTKALHNSLPKKSCELCGKPAKGHNRELCNSCLTKIRRMQTKLAAIKYLGGKCVHCGWSGNPFGFQFHHKNPSEKDFSIGAQSNRSWDIVKQELDKCELLCAICHEIEHSDVNTKYSDKFQYYLNKYNGKLDFDKVT